ncbi:MAG: urease accessory protein UreD [Desulfofustis sp.]|nr:urease accessory protein UreD [Desulfofustis sp.]
MNAALDNPGANGWPATLHLAYAATTRRTILTENSHHGPLRVQCPLYPEGAVCHTCILHPPGGVAGGDRLEVDLTVGPGAHTLVTTPGATKFYRSDQRPASQRQQLRVDGGTLEWFPQDSIVFPGAYADISTTIRLNGAAAFIGWEVICLGLPTRQEPFADGRLQTCLSLERDGIPLLRERLTVEARQDLDGPAGLRGYPVVGTFLAAGATESQVHQLRGLLQAAGRSLVGITVLGELLVGRYLGDSTFEARKIFQHFWACLRPTLLGRPACPPRVWST